jgi:hypothetical protein
MIHALNSGHDLIISAMYDKSDDPSITNNNGIWTTEAGMVIESPKDYIDWDSGQEPLSFITTFPDLIYIDSDENIHTPEIVDEDTYVPISETDGEIIYIKDDDTSENPEQIYINRDEEDEKVPEPVTPPEPEQPPYNPVQSFIDSLLDDEERIRERAEEIGEPDNAAEIAELTALNEYINILDEYHKLKVYLALNQRVKIIKTKLNKHY